MARNAMEKYYKTEYHAYGKARHLQRCQREPIPNLLQGERTHHNIIKHNENELPQFGGMERGLAICCFFTAKGGLFLRPKAAF